jgi:hypothetical protein
MRELAKIAKIQAIEPIKDKDRIELATIENYPVIVQKGEYKVGDLAVYVFYDTVLPQRKEFEFLRARCWSELYQGFRIRNMSMAGVYSSGIIFPLSILPKEVKVEEGLEVSKILEIRKYDPEEIAERQQGTPKKRPFGYKYLSKYRWYRKLFLRKKPTINYPHTVKKSDEDNIEKVFGIMQGLAKDHDFYITEKMEGQAGTWMLQGKKRKYMVFSRNTNRPPNGDGTWERVGRQYGLERILRKHKQNLAIQGEICGPGIQGNIYEFDKLRLFVYKVTNTDTGEAMNYLWLEQFCRNHGLEMVPVVAVAEKLPSTYMEIINQADGQSTHGGVLREGVVWRSMTDQNISFKAKSREYAGWFEGRNKTR